MDSGIHPRLHNTQRLNVMEHPETASLLLRFSRFIVRHRIVLGVLSAIFIVTTAGVSLALCRLPDLSDPSADFITIQTEWSAKVQQFSAFLAETKSSPWLPEPSEEQRPPIVPSAAKWLNGSLKHVFIPSESINEQSPTGLAKQYAKLNFCFGEQSSPTASENLWSTYQSYGRVVLSLDQDPKMSAPLNIFTEPGAFASLCVLQSRIYDLEVFKQECMHAPRPMHDSTHAQFTCCSALSVPNLIAAMLGHASCSEVQPTELVQINQLLTSCLPAFQSGKVKRACWDAYGSDPTLLCPFVSPVSCLRSPLIPLLLATTFPDMNGSTWRTTMLLLPIRGADSLSLFQILNTAYRSGDLTSHLPVPVYIHGMYMHAYNELVSDLIVRDSVWLLVALMTLLILLAVGTETVVVPLMTLIGIIWSVITAYAFYSRVLSIPHFPLLNLMAIVLAIGLGADDLLVYFQVWRSSQRSLRRSLTNCQSYTFEQYPLTALHDQLSKGDIPSQSRTACCAFECGIASDKITHHDVLAVRLRNTLRHAVPSITLTSISTSLGLLINLLSSVLAVQRFAVYAFLIVVCNFVYVVLVAPIFFVLQNSVHTLLKNTLRCSMNYFDTASKYFSDLILHIRYFLSFLFIVLTCSGSYMLFCEQNFLPRSYARETSFLYPTHTFETFLHTYTDWFWAERTLHRMSTLIPVHFVWGFKPKDSRSFWTFIHKEPLDSNQWIPDRELNLTSVESRQWLLAFCDHHLRQMPYVFNPSGVNFQQYGLSSLDVSYLNPYLDVPLWCPLGRYPNSLNNYMFAHACSNVSSHCCPDGISSTLISLSPKQFSLCVAEYVSFEHHIFPRVYQSGFRFSSESFQGPIGLVVSALTNLSLLKNSHEEIRVGVDKLSAWFNQVLLTAPDRLTGHLVMPTLEPFEVTESVLKYVRWSMLSTIVVAVLLVMISTRSLWLSFIAFLSLFSCLVVTGLLLILLDHWSLGMVEGLVLTLAAGLAIDPCLHLALSVSQSNRISRCSTRLGWTCESIRTSMCILNTAVTGSAGSTALAGLSMIACQLLCYHQIGVFLCILMTSSWLICYVMFASNLVCITDILEKLKLSR